MDTPQRTTRLERRKMLLITMLPLLVVVVFAAIKGKQRLLGNSPVSMFGKTDVTKPAFLAVWPWPHPKQETTHKGVTRYESSSSDGTTAILFDFDFKINPNLRFEIFDQDQDEKDPFDNKVHYWNRAVGQMTRQLNASGKAPVLAAWNGLFYGYYNKAVGDDGLAFHVSPVVLDGKVHFNTANHRWGFGVKYTAQGPVWKVAHLPNRAWFETLDWGGGSAQCLVKDGQPLKLQPFPAPGAPPLPQPVRSTPQEVGHIPIFDHMKTCRASLAWSRDNRHLYLLFIKENDSETASALSFKYRQPLLGGWTVPDLQLFWLNFQKEHGPLTAINSDAGDVAQLTYLRPDGKYELLPSRQGNGGNVRKVFSPDFKNAPDGGAIMYFYLRDAAKS